MRLFGLVLCLSIIGCQKEATSKYEVFTPQACSDTIYFQSEVKGPLIDLSCSVVNCHDQLTSANNIDYSSHANIVPITHAMYKSMAHDSGFVPMPSAENRVADSLLQKCYCWIQQGRLNN